MANIIPVVPFVVDQQQSVAIQRDCDMARVAGGAKKIVFSMPVPTGVLAIVDEESQEVIE